MTVPIVLYFFEERVYCQQDRFAVDFHFRVIRCTGFAEPIERNCGGASSVANQFQEFVAEDGT